MKKPTLDRLDISNYQDHIFLFFLKFLNVLCNQSINQSVVSLCYPELPRSYLSSVQILLDLSAAFNMVNHKTFLSVHTSLVIHVTAWWCASYLEGLSYQMTKSGPTGVPQDPVPLHPLSVRSHPLYLLSQWGYGFSYMAFYTTEDTQLMLSFPPSLMFLLGSQFLADSWSWMAAESEQD